MTPSDQIGATSSTAPAPNRVLLSRPNTGSKSRGIGIGERVTSPPVPPPDLRVRIRRFGRVKLTVSRERGKPERGEESVRQSELHCRRVGKVPRTTRATRGLRDLLHSDAALAELPISRGASFPLLPDQRPKSRSEPFLQLGEHFRCFASSEVADPSAEIFRYVMDHLNEAYTPGPPR